MNYVNGKYGLLKVDFDGFISFFNKVRLIELNKDDWTLSKCNCLSKCKTTFAIISLQLQHMKS